MQTSDQGRGLAGGEELGELDDGGDEEDEIVVARQSNRPQGDWTWLLASVSITGVGFFFCLKTRSKRQTREARKPKAWILARERQASHLP